MEQDETILDKLYRQHLTADMISRSANMIGKLVDLKNKRQQTQAEINVNVSDEELLKILLNSSKTISYWKQRCILAEKCLEQVKYPQSPADLHASYMCVEAYNKFIEENKEPKL